jgi:hypothetical protein
MHLARISSTLRIETLYNHLQQVPEPPERLAGRVGGRGFICGRAEWEGRTQAQSPRLVDKIGLERLLERLPEPYQIALFLSWVALHFVCLYYTSLLPDY